MAYLYDNKHLLTRSLRSSTRLERGYHGGYAHGGRVEPLSWRHAPHALATYFGLVVVLVLLPLALVRGGGRRSRLRRMRAAAIALFFVPVFGLDPNNILRLDAEAHAARDLAVALAGAAEQARYSYDDNGNLVLVELWDPAAGDGDGAFVAKDEYRHDPENRLVAHDPAPPDSVFGVLWVLCGSATSARMRPSRAPAANLRQHPRPAPTPTAHVLSSQHGHSVPPYLCNLHS